MFSRLPFCVDHSNDWVLLFSNELSVDISSLSFKSEVTLWSLLSLLSLLEWLELCPLLSTELELSFPDSWPPHSSSFVSFADLLFVSFIEFLLNISRQLLTFDLTKSFPFTKASLTLFFDDLRLFDLTWELLGLSLKYNFLGDLWLFDLRGELLGLSLTQKSYWLSHSLRISSSLSSFLSCSNFGRLWQFSLRVTRLLGLSLLDDCCLCQMPMSPWSHCISSTWTVSSWLVFSVNKIKKEGNVRKFEDIKEVINQKS